MRFDSWTFLQAPLSGYLFAMPYDQLAIVLNCYSFDEFPTHYCGEDADSLLAAWTGLWHPALLAAAGNVPTWHRADDAPENVPSALWVIARPMESEIQSRQLEAWAEQGVTLVRAPVRPEEVFQAAVAHQEPASSEAGAGAPLPLAEGVDADLVEDFYALGYAMLQIELLTRQMRYASQMEESAFTPTVLGAAKAAVSGDLPSAREQLQACFDLLAQERDHYYAVDVFLVDLSLVAAHVLAEGLPRQLDWSVPSNLMIPADLLGQMDASLCQRINDAAEASQADLVGGEYHELPLPLVPADALVSQIRQGLAAFESRLGRRPAIFGRRRFGLTPALPQVLLRFGFRAAVHATLDDGQFPEAPQTKARWEGDGDAQIDAIMRAPLDATLAETYLNLAGNISESMDVDHVATRSLAHWAGETSRWYHTLRRVTKQTAALGRFVTLTSYFDETYDSGVHDRFSIDQYHAPYLSQDVAAEVVDPLSGWQRRWRRFGELFAWRQAAAIDALLAGDAQANEVFRAAHQAYEQVLNSFDSHPCDPLGPLRADLIDQTERCLMQRLTGGQEGDSKEAITLFNPLSFTRRTVLTDAPRKGASVGQGLSTAAPVYATATASDGRDRAIVDVPSLGFAVLTRPQDKRREDRTKERSGDPPMAAEQVLRNEFFEAHVDPQTGSLRAIYDYEHRGNRLSQRLVYRSPGMSRDQLQAVRMVADRVDVTIAEPLLGEIVTQGKLLVGQEVAAHFSQTFRLSRGSRVLDLAIEIDPRLPLEKDAWNSYFACRFAWASEASTLARSVNQSRRPTSAGRIEAPLWIEIDDAVQRTTLLTDGLPYHRRVGMRMLDSLVSVRGETSHRVTLGIGVDLKQPLREAFARLVPTVERHDIVPAEMANRAAWLFHIDQPNVTLLQLSPQWQDDRVVGATLRLLETDGIACQPTVRAYCSLASAETIDFRGQTIHAMAVQQDQAIVPLKSREMVDLSLRFE